MTDFIPFNILLNEAEKRKRSQELAIMYENWRAAGGIPTVFTRKEVKARGMQKGMKRVPIGERHVGRFVIGEKQEPYKPWEKELARGIA